MAVHVGAPSGHRVSAKVPWPVPAGYDDGLRFDLLTGLVERRAAEQPAGDQPHGPSPVSAWLTRMGVPQPHDEDLAWHAASLRAFAAHGTPLEVFRVVTKGGWLDVRTGERRTWRRLRL
jgi:hypothetical protein